MKLWKVALYVVVIAAFASCNSYQLTTQSDVIYLEEGQDATSIFKNYDTDIIKLKFTTITHRFNYNKPYSYYWQTRPLWLDFNFYHGNYYSYYSHFYRPWNYWDYYMRPWRPFNNWTQGPFNNQGYNVVYNSSRRTSIKNIIINKPNKSRLVLNNKPVVSYKPVVKPRINYNKPKPIYNKPNYNTRPSFNSKPSFNSRPSYNSKPSNNNNSSSLVVRSLKKGN
jgi:hypothetical protein